ncbi:cation diffusion facilitator family transporter [Anaerovibrio sp.]|uniref:cation diffusion facilitator family transporter n=1 Tax=Anaerovibrio sp. TaxID=1872532 RepID=UPI003F14E268
MTEFLIRKFVKDFDNVNNSDVRKEYGLLSGGVGICVNLLLCIMKLAAGFASGSVGIIGDGINNLSDAGSSVVTMLGLKMSAKPADEEHPYGHGRIEYIAALIIAGIILLVGFELLKTSVGKLLEPEPVEVSVLALAVMAASVVFKVWLGIFNRQLGKKTDSPAFNAVALDSMSDCVATSVVIACLLIYEATGFNLDGAAGIVVGSFIMYSGWGAASETLQPILGKPADPEILGRIMEIAIRDRRVLGVHDVMAHSYGPGNVFASVHIEVISTMTLMEAHAVASRLEHAIDKELDIQAIVHVDPKLVGNPEFDALVKKLSEVLKGIDDSLSMHDVHIFHGNRLVFDVEVPYSYPAGDAELEKMIVSAMEACEPDYRVAVKLDRM